WQAVRVLDKCFALSALATCKRGAPLSPLDPLRKFKSTPILPRQNGVKCRSISPCKTTSEGIATRSRMATKKGTQLNTACRYRVRLLVSFSVDDFEVNDASNAYHTDWNAKPRACIGSIANNHENTKDGDEY
ncbi:hypothetical protein, partial [Lacticaseibacillus suibinensis]|uniref:hypothetical protein n=1 Tax=Lacticaseibacillus suibinensis TaxID=2486011 RepID=UPI0019437958